MLSIAIISFAVATICTAIRICRWAIDRGLRRQRMAAERERIRRRDAVLRAIWLPCSEWELRREWSREAGW